jgi:hypothetical protein
MYVRFYIPVFPYFFVFVVLLSVLLMVFVILKTISIFICIKINLQIEIQITVEINYLFDVAVRYNVTHAPFNTSNIIQTHPPHHLSRPQFGTLH